MIAFRLDFVVRAVCPIDGVSIGDEFDRSTWRVFFKPEATAQQRTDAQMVLETFDPNVLTPEEQRIDAIKADVIVADLLARLRVATLAQISTYVDNNVADTVPGVRAMFKRVLAVMALIANGA